MGATEPQAVIETRGLRRVFKSRNRQVEAVAWVDLVVLTAVSVVISARQFGRAVA